MIFKRSGQQAAGGISRRAFLNRVGVAAAASLLVPSADAFALSLGKQRRISLFNTNTREEWGFICSPQQNYDTNLLSDFSHFLRDHRTDEARIMDPALLDLLYAVTVLTGGRGEYNIISGYRTPETNQMLRKASHGVAEHSLHIQGKAIDLRTHDVSTRTIQQVALSLQQGGVGYYHSADFVHMDTGDIRSW
ncbi:MAG: YcbK family protein [Candidatus Methylumidiphilus sp.]